MDQERIGQFIKKIRQDNNLTQKDFADRLGVTFQAVSKWENGKNVPDIAILKQISDDFNVDISEILDGEKKDKKENINIYRILLIIIFIGLLILGTIVYNKNDDYEFKTISSKCEDFKISGSAAYNKEKATIYISNVEFCGKEDKTKYKKITCKLYENYKETKTEISNCDTKNNINLEEYLKELNLEVEHYTKTCKKLTSNSLLLEIQATQEDNKTTVYTIPIKLNDTCK